MTEVTGLRDTEATRMGGGADTGVRGVPERLDWRCWGGHCTHISELVVSEMGFVALKELHSQVAVQPVPFLQIQTWFRAQPCPRERGWAGTEPAPGQDGPRGAHTLSSSSLLMVFLASSSLLVSSTISQSSVFLSISAFLI